MSDYISKKRVYRILTDLMTESGKEAKIMLSDAKAQVYDEDDVDVVTGVHSHWIWGPYVAKIGGHGYTCAACGKQSEECRNYCTWCGAKMDDEEQMEAEREEK